MRERESNASHDGATCGFAPGELAWAGGFFDGEGSTVARRDARRPGYLQLLVTVGQHGDGHVPAVLVRLQAALLGMGSISRPNRNGIYQWRSRGYTEAQAAIALLWRYLGLVKRQQAAKCALKVRHQYAAGVYRSRRPRSTERATSTVAETRPLEQEDLERIWAAGFLDAEGCFGMVRWGSRVRGAPWYRIRVSATQHGGAGSPAEVLVRLQGVLGGRIERHGQPDDFKWLVEGVTGVERVLEMTAPWLGEVKLEQARKAIAAFRAQIRLKGDSQRCVRGHLYERQASRGGRPRRICNACARITARRRRAAQGIPPRPFRDPSRRYTE